MEQLLTQICICLVGGDESIPNNRITFKEISQLAEIGWKDFL